ncbi:hypothetical protein [Corynebacterium lowii]|uniref:Uncharacterized protein n=1 Tax=Corynebacterium lowii TaxID=1544413 RepID=A0A0Q0YXT6_9CORY|nr:hypothetical protein [Corynebacterium lowii]KQB87185.1 hypothetical protein Clow_00238 [Corynebacterium lowii]
MLFKRKHVEVIWGAVFARGDEWCMIRMMEICIPGGICGVIYTDGRTGNDNSIIKRFYSARDSRDSVWWIFRFGEGDYVFANKSRRMSFHDTIEAIRLSFLDLEPFLSGVEVVAEIAAGVMKLHPYTGVHEKGYWYTVEGDRSREKMEYYYDIDPLPLKVVSLMWDNLPPRVQSGVMDDGVYDHQWDGMDYVLWYAAHNNLRISEELLDEIEEAMHRREEYCGLVSSIAALRAANRADSGN